MLPNTQKYLRDTYTYHNGRLFKDGKDMTEVVGGVPMLRMPVGGMLQLRTAVWIYHYGNVPEGKVLVHLNESLYDSDIESLRVVELDDFAEELL